MSNKEFNEERQELDEIEYLNNLVKEQMARVQAEQWDREARMDLKRVEHERRVNAIIRMISVSLMYAAIAAAMLILAYTRVVVWWLSGSVAVGLAVCGAFRAGYYWRESKI